MIGFWRKRSKTVIVHLVFWPIIAVFVIWGFERAGNPVGAAAAVVNDHTISIAEYRNALQRMTDFYSQMFQGRFDDQAIKMYRVRENALNQLITGELISEQAEQMGVEVTDEEVRQKLAESPMLMKDGRFSRENYEGLLKYYHMTPSQFEGELRRTTLVDKTRKIFEGHLQSSVSQQEKDKTLRDTKLNLDFLKIDKNDLWSKLSISESDVASFLKVPSQEKKAKEYYDLHKATYSQEEQVSAHHILIKATKGNKGEEAAAREKISKIQAELKTSTFENLAKKYSDDPGSKIKGGDLGSFSRGRMVPEFEKVAFVLPIGKISEPVQSEFGFHLIRVDSRKAASTTTFAEARQTIAKKLVAEKKIDDVIDSAEKKLKSSPQEAVKELQALGPQVKWDETGVFAVGDERIPKIGEADDAVGVALGLSSEKPYAQKLVHAGDVFYALKFKSMSQASAAPLASADAKLASNAKGAGGDANEVFYNWSNGLVEKAKIKRNPRLFSDDAPVED
jgi:peptidyl-prolyl cis-trans isomerase D